MKSKFIALSTVSVVVAGASLPYGITSYADSSPTINLTMEVGDGGQALQLQQQAVNLFEKQHPNIHVTLTSDTSSYFQSRLLTEFANGTAPDVFAPGDTNVQEFVKSGDVQDLTPLEKTDPTFAANIKAMFPKVLNVGVVNGKLYFVPKDWASEAVLYNQSLFAKSHIPYPKAGWTWSEFLKDAQKLTQTQNGRTIQWGVQLPGDWLRAGVSDFVAAWGGAILSPNGKTVNGYLNSPKSIRALQYYFDLYNKYNIAPSPSAQASFGKIDLFQSGKVAMEITGPWNTATYAQNKNFHFAVAPMPVGPSEEPTSEIFWGGYCVNVHSAHLAAADELVKYFATKTWANIDGTFAMPARADSDRLSLNSDPYLKGFFTEANYLAPLEEVKTLNFNKDVQVPLTNMIDTMLASGPKPNLKQEIEQTVTKIDQNLSATYSQQ